MIIDHIGVSVSDPETSREFYRQCLAPLGIELLAEDQGWAGFGRAGIPQFWFGADTVVNTPMHIAFSAQNRAAVDAFYQAALAAGGRANGAPGIRALYHADYYGAFVLDPDGHNVEAVCHSPV